MSREGKDKKDVNINEGLDSLKEALENYVKENSSKDEEVVYTAYTFLQWLKKKTEIVQKEKTFEIPEGIELKRGKVFWIDFGFNIGQEFGGKHPAIIYRVSGGQVFVFPLTTQEPDEEKPPFVKIPFVFDFPNMKRWVNVLNLKCVSINRIDFESCNGRVKPEFLKKIGEAWKEKGIR